MEREELLARAKAWLAIPSPRNRTEANMKELNVLFNAATGRNVSCTSCVFNAMATELQRYTTSPESFTIQPSTQQIMANKSTKYKPSKAAIANGVEVVVLNHGSTSEAIKLSEMSNEQAERILKNKRFAHNVEEIKQKAEDTAAAEPAKKATKAKAAETEKEEATEPAKSEE